MFLKVVHCALILNPNYVILINVQTFINRGLICHCNISTKHPKPKHKFNLFCIVILPFESFLNSFCDNISKILHTGGRILNWVNLVKSLCHFYCIIFSYKHCFHWKCNLFITRLHILDLGNIGVWNTSFELLYSVVFNYVLWNCFHKEYSW